MAKINLIRRRILTLKHVSDFLRRVTKRRQLQAISVSFPTLIALTLIITLNECRLIAGSTVNAHVFCSHFPVRNTFSCEVNDLHADRSSCLLFFHQCVLVVYIITSRISIHRGDSSLIPGQSARWYLRDIKWY